MGTHLFFPAAFNYDAANNKDISFCMHGAPAGSPLCVKAPIDQFDFIDFHHVCLVVTTSSVGKETAATLYYDREKVEKKFGEGEWTT